MNNDSNEMVGSVNDSGSIPPSSAPSEAPQEKLFRQADVNQIVSSRVNKASEKAKEEGYQKALQELQSQEANSSFDEQSQQNFSPALDSQSKKYTDEEKLIGLLNNELDRRDNESQQKREVKELTDTMNRVDNFLAEKIQAESKDRPEVNEKLASMSYFDKTPEIKFYAASTEDPVGFMEHVASNHAAYAALMASNHDPVTQQSIANQISARLKKNKEAGNVNKAAPPLNHVESSLGSNSPDGNPTMSDFKRMFKG